MKPALLFFKTGSWHAYNEDGRLILHRQSKATAIRDLAANDYYIVSWSSRIGRGILDLIRNVPSQAWSRENTVDRFLR